MKDTFEGFCPSNFCFPKFHLTTHYPEVIEEFGSLHTVSSAHGERTHKTEVKPAHRRTSKKKRTATGELLDVLQIKESLEQLSVAYDIHRTAGVRRGTSRDGQDHMSSRASRTPGSTLSGFVTGDHVFEGKRFTMRSYRSGDIPADFRFPKHETAFRGYLILILGYINIH